MKGIVLFVAGLGIVFLASAFRPLAQIGSAKCVPIRGRAFIPNGLPLALLLRPPPTLLGSNFRAIPLARSIAGYRVLMGDASAEVMRLVGRDLDHRSAISVRPSTNAGAAPSQGMPSIASSTVSTVSAPAAGAARPGTPEVAITSKG
jgi:hypothetical protein